MNYKEKEKAVKEYMDSLGTLMMGAKMTVESERKIFSLAQCQSEGITIKEVKLADGNSLMTIQFVAPTELMKDIKSAIDGEETDLIIEKVNPKKGFGHN